MMLAEGILLGLAIGTGLGIVGAGGSILAVPGLIGVMGLSATAATTSSLIIVGSAAFAGVIPRLKTKSVNVWMGITFSLLGAVGTFLGTRLLPVVPEPLVIGLFAVLMFGAAIAMWRGPVSHARESRTPARWRIVAVASAIGVVTGLLGVGGGFLIVPSLLLLLGVPTRIAAGTSLVAIAINSVIALLMRYEYWHLVPAGPITAFAIAGVTASFLSAPLAHRIEPQALQRAFAGLVVLVATYMLITLIRAQIS
jgi:uncharacterized membrane protein YfcA